MSTAPPSDPASSAPAHEAPALATPRPPALEEPRPPPASEPPLRGVAFVATPPEVVEAMLDLAKISKDDLVYDLGCGDGRILVAAARRGARGYGVDLDPARVAEARENAKAGGLSDRITIEQRDMFTVDLSPATVVMLFVTAEYNEKLLPQLQKLKPGARVVSHWFGIPNHPPDEVVTVPRLPGADWPRPGEPGFGEPHSVYLWVAPLSAPH
jgi:SAM-dependent methyltransferase